MTENEKKIMSLLPQLEEIDKDYLQEFADGMCWQDWDFNCHHSDEIRICEAIDDYQVIRRFDVELEKLWQPIEINKPDEWEPWVSDVDVDSLEVFEDTDEDGNVHEYADAIHYKGAIEGEFALWWINVKTGEIVFLGKADKQDANYCDASQPWRIYRECDTFYQRFFSGCIGMQTRHFEHSIHPTLKAMHYQGIEVNEWEDLNYTDGIGNWYYNISGNIHLHIQKLLTELWYSNLVSTYGLDIVPYTDKADYLLAFRIAMRHHYDIVNLKAYIKHLDNCIYLAKDLHNPHFVCPSADIIDLMQRQADNRKARIREAEERERRRKEAYENERAEEIFYELRKDYLGIQFSNEHFSVHVLASKAEYYEEGEAMHHCVGKCGYWRKTSSICVGIRDLQGKRQATAEISLQKFSIIQCYTYCDKVHDQDEEIRQLIMDHMHLFRNATEGEQEVQLAIAV